MIVCHCHCVTDREINAAIDSGAETAEDIGDACGAGTCCGGCRPTIDALVEAGGPSATPVVSLRLSRSSWPDAAQSA